MASTRQREGPQSGRCLHILDPKESKPFLLTCSGDSSLAGEPLCSVLLRTVASAPLPETRQPPSKETLFSLGSTDGPWLGQDKKAWHPVSVLLAGFPLGRFHSPGTEAG